MFGPFCPGYQKYIPGNLQLIRNIFTFYQIHLSDNFEQPELEQKLQEISVKTLSQLKILFELHWRHAGDLTFGNKSNITVDPHSYVMLQMMKETKIIIVSEQERRNII